ncbi:hypothetical protein ABID46_002625 [Moheibacter stercoris]|uniref:Lipocalin-like domain-containing protein n=2 Tax=Moheibacter stercoris TaxID=1628251 RepID=A0ABV2LWU2_9FLAO
MKTYTLILTTILSLFTILSCNNDDESQQVQSDNQPIVGKWHLISKKAGMGDAITFLPNEVVWEFKNGNEIIRTINMEINNTVLALLHPYHVSGSQNYYLDEVEDRVTFDLDYMPEGQNSLTYPFRIESDTLILGEQSSYDASFIYKFAKD